MNDWKLFRARDIIIAIFLVYEILRVICNGDGRASEWLSSHSNKNRFNLLYIEQFKHLLVMNSIS